MDDMEGVEEKMGEGAIRVKRSRGKVMAEGKH